jgi:hypothetical protein
MAENKAFSKVGDDVNQFKLNGLVRFSFKSLTTNKAKKPFISFLLTQYRMAGKVGEQKEFSKTFQVLVFDEKIVDTLRVIDQQVRVEVFGNIGIKVEQNGMRRVSVPTLIATSVVVSEYLNTPFQETGKPAPKVSNNLGNPSDEEIKQLEKSLKAFEDKKRIKPSNQPVVSVEDSDDLPF